jgi:hypothetical protein
MHQETPEKCKFSADQYRRTLGRSAPDPFLGFRNMEEAKELTETWNVNSKGTHLFWPVCP